MKFLTILSAVSFIAAVSPFATNAEKVRVKIHSCTEACEKEIAEANPEIDQLIIKNCTTDNGCEAEFTLPECATTHCTVDMKVKM
jgi:hypothetical protein